MPCTETRTTEEPLRKASSCSSRCRHRASGPGGQPVTRGYGAPRLVPVRKQLRYLCAGVTLSFFSRVLVRNTVTANSQSGPICSIKWYRIQDIVFTRGSSPTASMDSSLVSFVDNGTYSGCIREQKSGYSCWKRISSVDIVRSLFYCRVIF